MESRVSTATKMSSKNNETHSIHFPINFHVIIVYSFRKIMDTFTKQSGDPTLNVTKVVQPNKPTKYHLTQKRLFSNAADENIPTNDNDIRYRWIIPLTYVIDSNATIQPKLFQTRDSTCNANINALPSSFVYICSYSNLPNDTKWIKFNKEQVEYYRNHYELSEWC